MKQTAIIVTALIYLFLSVGIRVNTHYCGDKVSSIDLFFDSKNCCGQEDIAKKCCKDKVSYLKLSDSQKDSPVFSFVAPDFSEVLIPAVDFIKTFLLINQEAPVYTILFFDSDHPLEKTPIYIINRSFRV